MLPVFSYLNTSPNLVYNKLKPEIFFFIVYSNFFKSFLRMHALVSIYFSFYATAQVFLTVKNFLPTTQNLSLNNFARAVATHKKFYGLLPDSNKLRLKAANNFLTNRASIQTQQQVTGQSQKTFSQVYTKIKSTSRFYKSYTKIKYSPVVNYRKRFKVLQRQYFKNFGHPIFFFRARVNFVKTLLRRYARKSFYGVSLCLALDPRHLVSRIFPFFSKSFLREIFYFGLVYVNFKAVRPHCHSLQVGDFVHIIWSPLFIDLYTKYINLQLAYPSLLLKDIRHHYQHLKSPTENRRKPCLWKSNNYHGIFKSTPTWVELNYVSLSFMIISLPRKFAFAATRFNPYLSRLVSF